MRPRQSRTTSYLQHSRAHNRLHDDLLGLRGIEQQLKFHARQRQSQMQRRRESRWLTTIPSKRVSLGLSVV